MSPWKDQNSTACLGNLREGVHAAVCSSTNDDELHLRLQEMGVVPGTLVKVLTEGANMVIKVGDHRLCLPKDEANRVEVIPV